MSTTILFTIISLSAIGAAAALILYFVAQKFKVFEDPRIDQVEEMTGLDFISAVPDELEADIEDDVELMW